MPRGPHVHLIPSFGPGMIFILFRVHATATATTTTTTSVKGNERRDEKNKM
jgi:hypothetical protein